uniref:Uncharacterized protein n=1 Tax=Ditylenchus dipsaci TaxID=166011 RepID=A0A915CY27_9BILA
MHWLIYFVVFTELAGCATAIYCYECTGGENSRTTCGHYTGTSCGYGFFGCIKIATYSGGVNKMGNFIDQDRNIVSMVRGCNLLPIGGVDACQQQIILGMRIVTFQPTCSFTLA